MAEYVVLRTDGAERDLEEIYRYVPKADSRANPPSPRWCDLRPAAMELSGLALRAGRQWNHARHQRVIPVVSRVVSDNPLEVYLMPMAREELEAQARQLPREERARLAEALISSLDEEAEVERAWDEEIRRRLQELDAGSVETVPGEEVLAELDKLVE